MSNDDSESEEILYWQDDDKWMRVKEKESDEICLPIETLKTQPAARRQIDREKETDLMSV